MSLLLTVNRAGFNIPLNKFYVNSVFPANLLTAATFSTNHLTDIDKTKHNQNQEQNNKNLNNKQKNY